MTDTASLTDFGAKIEAEGQRDRCQAFDQHGDRCPYKRESDSQFCPDCDAESALTTVDELTAGKQPDGGVYSATGVKDILRDGYAFPPQDALVLASGSAISTFHILEGRLAWAAKEDTETFTVRNHEYRVERGRELLALARSNVTSASVREKWGSACLAVCRWRSRCSQTVDRGSTCGFHDDLDEHEFRLDEYLSVYGPDGGDN